MEPKQEALMNYIDTLSRAHSAGHKCDREIADAIELYTVAAGIKEMKKVIEEKVISEAKELAAKVVWEFHRKVSPAHDVYGDFFDFMSGKRIKNMLESGE